jgi:6-phosphofructokinase 1
VRENTKKYRVAFAPVTIQNAAKYTRSVPKEYIAKSGNDVTDAFLDYARPIVGELPHCEIL